MEQLTLYFPTGNGTTAQVVRVLDTDEETNLIKVQVVGRTDGSRRSVGAVKFMKPESLRYNYHPQEYVRHDHITTPVDLATVFHLDDTDWYPAPTEPEELSAPAQIAADADAGDLFALIEEQTERINQIGTVNTDVLKELRQIRGLMAKLVTLFEQATEDEDDGTVVGSWVPVYDQVDDPPPPRTTDELTSGSTYHGAAN